MNKDLEALKRIIEQSIDIGELNQIARQQRQVRRANIHLKVIDVNERHTRINVYNRNALSGTLCVLTEDAVAIMSLLNEGNQHESQIHQQLPSDNPRGTKDSGEQSE